MEPIQKVDYASQRRPRKIPIEIVLEDKGLPHPQHMSLMPLDRYEQDRADEKCAELVARYVTGGYYHPVTKEWTTEPETFPPIDDQPVQMSDRALTTLCRIHAMEAHLAKDDPRYYSFEELACMPVLQPGAWSELQMKAGEVQQKKGWTQPKK